MKSLLLVRSPLLKKKRYLGIFTSRKKKLGNVYLKNHLSDTDPKRITVLSSSFTKSKRTADVISKKVNIQAENVSINSRIQDLDSLGCIDLLSQINDRYSTVVLIASGVVVSDLFFQLTQTKKIIPFGQTELVKFDINEWDKLTRDSIKTGKLMILKSA